MGTSGVQRCAELFETTGVALVAASVAPLAYDYITSRSRLVRDVTTLADIVKGPVSYVVASKRDILAGVWEDDFEGDPNIVEVYIGRLRRKLSHPADIKPVITTIRGAGYRLEVD